MSSIANGGCRQTMTSDLHVIAEGDSCNVSSCEEEKPAVKGDDENSKELDTGRKEVKYSNIPDNDMLICSLNEKDTNTLKATTPASTLDEFAGCLLKPIDCFSFFDKKSSVLTTIGSRDPKVKKQVYSQYREMLKSYKNNNNTSTKETLDKGI